MADIGTAYVRIEPTAQGISGKIEKELGGAGVSGGQAFSKGFGSVIGGVGKATLGIAAAGAAGITALGAGVVNASKDVAAYGDNIDKMSQKMGLSAQAYQEWDAVMQHSGTSMETMKSSMKTLANAAETNNAAFKELGITEEQLKSMSQEQLFEATIAGLQNVEDTTQRTYLAGKLLGRGATELGALLNTSAEDTQKMRDRVKELGGVMSNDAVKNAAAFQDQLQDMQTAFQGLSRNMVSGFLPNITQVMSGLTEIFSGNTEEGISQISEGINSLVTNITEALPKVVEVGGKILGAIGEAIIANLPMLMQCATDILMGLVDFIIQNLPALIEAGLQIVMQLALGIAQALPTLIPQIVDVVLTIVQYLIENADLLIEGAIALIIGLAEGLINALPILIEKLPELIIAIVTALIDNAPLLLQAAIQLIFMLAQGIIQAIPTAVTALISLVTKLFETLKEKYPEFLAKGKELITQLCDGIVALKDKAKESMTQIFTNIKDSVTGWLDKAREWGSDLIMNFINGIKDKFSAVGDTMSDLANTVASYIHFSEPDEGPLSDFHTYAPDMIKLFTEGLKNNEDLVKKQMSETFAIPTPDYDTDYTAATYAPYNASANTDENGILNLLSTYLPLLDRDTNVNVSLEGDAQGLFRMVQNENKVFKRMTGSSAFA